MAVQTSAAACKSGPAGRETSCIVSAIVRSDCVGAIATCSSGTNGAGTRTRRIAPTSHKIATAAPIVHEESSVSARDVE